MAEQLPETVKYIYGYIRRSRQDIKREKKVNQDTLTEQRTLITGFLENNYSYVDWDIYEEYGSGADEIKSRPVFKQILEDLKNVKPRTVAICVKEISRLGRGDYEQMGMIMNLIEGNQVYIVTPYQIFDPMSTSDMEVIKFHMFIAHMEYGKITQRMREARYTYASQGRWMTGGGGIPYGYKFNPKDQILEPDEKTAEVVQHIFDLYVNKGLGYNAISTRLVKEGIPTPTGKTYWKPMVIRRMLLNPVYLGTVQFRTTVTKKGKKIKMEEKDWIVKENAHQPLIDKETFNKAAVIMQTNKSKPNVKLEFEPQPLAGLIVCSECGNKMQRQYSTQHYKKKDGNTSVYHKEFMMCLGCHVYIKYRSIEEEILKILENDFIKVDITTLKEKINELVDMENKLIKNSFDPTDKVQIFEKQLEKIEGELTRLRRMLRKEQITDEEYEEDRKELMKEKKEKEIQINILKKEDQKDKIEELDAKKIQQGFKTILDLYRNGNLSNGEKNELLRGIFDYIVLTKTGKGKFDLNAYLNPKILLTT